MNIQKLSKAVQAASAVVLAVMASASCQRADTYPDYANGAADGMVRFVIDGESGLKSSPAAAAQSLEPVVLEGADTSLIMRVSSRPISSPAVSAGSTKGVHINSSNIVTERDTDITVTAYDMKDVTAPYIKPRIIRFESSWKVADSISVWNFYDTASRKFVNYSWPSDEVRFFAWSPANAVKDPELDAAKGIISTDYTMPAPDKTVKRDADAQPDLLLAMTLTPRTSDNYAHLRFDHALSALRFEIGKTNDLVVQEITLENVLSSGTVAYDPSDAVKPVDWTGLANPQTFVQTFTAEEGQIHEDLAYKPGGGRDPQGIGCDVSTFMVIPQISGKSAETKVRLSITFVLKDTETQITFSKELDETNASWAPGMEYKYTLNITNGLDIEIDDRVSDDGKTKDNLTITNVGGKPAYVRALVVGYWVNASKDIVALWDPANTAMGTFTPAIFAATPDLNENWVKGADGFFYYTKILPAGETTVTRLFDSYVANEDGKPKNLKLSDYLEIDIVSQAVIADEGKAAITTAWGETAAGYMTE